MTSRSVWKMAATAAAVLALAGCQDEPTAPPDGASGPAFASTSHGGGNGGTDKEKGDLYADLMIILRDVNGVPIVYPEMFVDERGNEIYCVQPVTFDLAVPHPDYLMAVEGAPETITPQTHAVDGRQVSLVPIYAQFQQYLPVEEEEANADAGTMSDDELVVAPGPCDIILFSEPILDPNGVVVALDTIYDYNPYANEVELERLNMARASESVLRKQMVEVETLFRITEPALVTLDPAGRPVFDGVMIDAMPKLQGIREALLETGTIPGASAYPYPFQLVSTGFTAWSTWDISAFALGGSASKFGRINIDAVSYHDRVMTIPTDASWDWAQLDDPQYLPFYSAELKEYFVNYAGFSYDRAATYAGCVTYINEEAGDWDYVARFLDAVAFTDLGPGVPGTSNILGYAQMADDARAVIFWIHEHEALIKYADPVGKNTCATQGLTGL